MLLRVCAKHRRALLSCPPMFRGTGVRYLEVGSDAVAMIGRHPIYNLVSGK